MRMPEVRVALNIGSKKHRVGIGGSEGAILEEFDITHDREGFERFFSRVGACQEPDPKAKAWP